MAEHVAAAVKRQDHLDILRKAQDDLNQLEHRSTTAFYGSARNIKTIMDYQSKVLDIEEKVYQGGNWPDHIEPMPSALRALGCMYVDLKYVVGLEFVLQGTFYSRTHAGPRWVLDLMSLVKYMIYFGNAPMNCSTGLVLHHPRPSAAGSPCGTLPRDTSSSYA